MRYFVIQGWDVDSPTYVLAEVVADPQIITPTGHEWTGADENARAAAANGGSVLGEAELLSIEGGRAALKAWRAGDDSAHAAYVRREFEDSVIQDELTGGVWTPYK